MRALEPWVVRPLQDFVSESSARLTLLMTSSGQVVAQHGFTGALDLMSAAALGAAIVSSSSEIAREAPDSYCIHFQPPSWRESHPYTRPL